MTANLPSRPLALLLVDSDPIFRLGLVTVLGDVADRPAIDQTATQDGALARLGQQGFDIILVALNQDPDWLNFCQTLRSSYPNLPLLILGTAPSQQAAAQAVGAQGFCVKGIAVGELVGAIRQVVGGATYVAPTHSSCRCRRP
ncbi:MAG: response regulator transcription factor, partial [Chloroflexaceae bacterium]|nr:response regulator transcription factor [Chloroflexaceae bacterium]